MNRFKKISKEQFIHCYELASSKSDLLRRLELPINGTSSRYIARMLSELELDPISTVYKSKYPMVTKNCPVCHSEFQSRSGGSEERATCSYSCSNTYFRSGSNNGVFKDGSSNYRNIAKIHLEQKCNRCGYNKYPILEVHHKDRNRGNNDISNLEYLCPNCHDEEHYLRKDGKWKMLHPKPGILPD